MTDENYMKLALIEAQKAEAIGEVPIGAVIVNRGQIITGHNRTIIDHDPSAHAEIIALRQAGHIFKNHRFTDAELFVTLEPCVMCIGALIQARIKRLVFGAYDIRFGACGSCHDLARSPDLNHQISDIKSGVCAEQARQILQEFFRKRRKVAP